MLEYLKKSNPDICFYSIHDAEFKKFGRVLDIETDEIVKACEKISMPNEGSMYVPSKAELENLDCSEKIREIVFGGCKAQIGLCWGSNSYLNGLEFHRSSEINIAATPLVLLVGLEYDMQGNEYNSDNIKAFYLEKGDAIEVYATTLHFCPCQLSDKGFSCVVGLPEGTNTNLEAKTDDKLLFRKNKWLICHDKNTALIDKGVYPGIHGENYKVNY